MAAARGTLAAYNLDRVFFENGIGFSSEYFTLARTLLRWATESQQAQRRTPSGIHGCAQAAIERQMAPPSPIYPGVEQAS